MSTKPSDQPPASDGSGSADSNPKLLIELSPLSIEAIAAIVASKLSRENLLHSRLPGTGKGKEPGGTTYK